MLVFTTVERETDYAVLAAIFFLIGIGMGLTMAPSTTLVMDSILMTRLELVVRRMTLVGKLVGPSVSYRGKRGKRDLSERDGGPSGLGGPFGCGL